MKFRYHFLALSLFLIFATACKSDPLEEYFVNASENPDFITVNIPANATYFDSGNIETDQQNQEERSHMNILVYKNDLNSQQKAIEFDKARKIIHSPSFKTLTKIKNKGYNISFVYQGKPDKIDEVVFLGKDQEYNFIIGMLKGDDVNAENLISLFKFIKNIGSSQAKNTIDTIKTDE